MSSTHKAIGLVAAKTIGEFEVPTRSPGPEEVQLKVDYAAFTAADGHAVHNGFYIQGYPAQIGLVATGTVVEVGSGVTLFQKGDIVSARELGRIVLETYLTYRVSGGSVHSARRRFGTTTIRYSAPKSGDQGAIPRNCLSL